MSDTPPVIMVCKTCGEPDGRHIQQELRADLYDAKASIDVLETQVENLNEAAETLDSVADSQTDRINELVRYRAAFALACENVSDAQARQWWAETESEDHTVPLAPVTTGAINLTQAISADEVLQLWRDGRLWRGPIDG